MAVFREEFFEFVGGKAVIRCGMFDFGHVLAPFFAQRFYDYVRVHQPPGAVEPERFLGFACVTRFDIGDISVEEFCEEIKRHLKINVSDREFLFHYCDNIIVPDPKMILLKRTLKTNGLKLALVSNINEYHFDYIQSNHPEVFADFDFLALSFKLGVRKPNLKMFNVPTQQLDVRPEECFFVDDLQINVEAFERWGGIGHHFRATDDKGNPSRWRNIEFNKLLVRMVSLGMINWSQAGELSNVIR